MSLWVRLKMCWMSIRICTPKVWRQSKHLARGDSLHVTYRLDTFSLAEMNDSVLGK